MVPNLDVSVFCRDFEPDLLGVYFKYDNSFFKILGQKYTNKTFLIPNLEFSSVLETYYLDNFRVQIPNMTIAISNSSTNIRKSGIFGSKFRHSCPRNFPIRKIWGDGFKYDNSIFKFHPKTRKSGIFGPKFKDFYFASDFVIS